MILQPASRNLSKSGPILDCDPELQASLPFSDFPFIVCNRFFGGVTSTFPFFKPIFPLKPASSIKCVCLFDSTPSRCWGSVAGAVAMQRCHCL